MQPPALSTGPLTNDGRPATPIGSPSQPSVQSQRSTLADPRTRARVWRATLVAVLVVLFSDGAYRLATARYAQISSSTPIPAGSLAQVPLRINDWTGRDVPMDSEIVRVTGTDDRINRVYSRGSAKVTFYIAYGVRIRDLAPHRPEICYTGAGWNLETRRDTELHAAGGLTLPCQIQTFSRGALDHEQVTVLNYYLVNGIHSADVSGLRWQAWRLDRSSSYSAQIQVTCGGIAPERAEMLVKQFAVQSAPAVQDVLARAVRAAAESLPVDR